MRTGRRKQRSIETNGSVTSNCRNVGDYLRENYGNQVATARVIGVDRGTLRRIITNKLENVTPVIEVNGLLHTCPVLPRKDYAV